MPLPSFDPSGLLPPFNGADAATADRSPYFCAMSEMCAAFGTSDHRKDLLCKLIAYRALIASDDYVDGLQFIDGSFVENVEALESRNPNDIDVFSMLVPPQKYLNDPASWLASGLPFWKSEITDIAKNKSRFSVDSYALMINPGQPAAFLQQALYWYSLFSHKKTTFAWKGFVAVALNPIDDQAALTALGGP